MTARLVTIFGGSGFLGRHTVRALARDGWRIRVAVRHPNSAFFLKPCPARWARSRRLSTHVVIRIRLPPLSPAPMLVNFTGILFQRVQSFEEESIATAP